MVVLFSGWRGGVRRPPWPGPLRGRCARPVWSLCAVRETDRRLCHAATVRVVADVLVAVVALLHAYFLVLEMFLWTRPQGRTAFGLTREFAEETKVLAANQ